MGIQGPPISLQESLHPGHNTVASTHSRWEQLLFQHPGCTAYLRQATRFLTSECKSQDLSSHPQKADAARQKGNVGFRALVSDTS